MTLRASLQISRLPRSITLANRIPQFVYKISKYLQTIKYLQVIAPKLKHKQSIRLLTYKQASIESHVCFACLLASLGIAI